MDEPDASAGQLIPIGAVSQRTGLSTHLLRAWEKRYQAVEPKRMHGGVRGYDDADVVKLRLLKRVTESGFAIGRVAALSTSELLGILKDEPVVMPRKRGAEARMADCLEAVEAMDGTRVHALLTRSMVIMGAEPFVDELVVPLLYRIGELWERGSICPAHEHLFSAALHRVLAWMIERLAIEGAAPTLLATTPAGQRHELGALLSAVVAAEEGWRVEYLGPDLPAGDIVRAASETGARIVALSVVRETPPMALVGELKVLRAGLAADVSILLGGRGASGHRDEVSLAGVLWLPNLSALRAELRRVRQLHVEVM